MKACRRIAFALALLATATPSFAAAPAPKPAPAARRAVDLELVIATDHSGSIDPYEASLQRRGIAMAFQSPEVVRAIQSGSIGAIAVMLLDWSSLPYTRLVADWRVISSKTTADQFAATLLAAPPGYGQGTAIGESLQIAASLIESNNFDGERRVIDVSGDGPNNRGPDVAEVRDDLVAKGYIVNGLPVVITGEYGNGDWGKFYPDIEKYYQNCIVGGPGSFSLPARGFQEFANAMRRKLVLEISMNRTANAIVPAVAAPKSNPKLAPRPRLTTPPAANCISGQYDNFGGFGRGF